MIDIFININMFIINMGDFIFPAIIAENQQKLDELCERLHFASVLHLDIMDGKFVSGRSLDFPFNLSKNFEYQAHLMVNNPYDWIKKFLDQKSIKTFVFHYESFYDKDFDLLTSTLDLMKIYGKKRGLAINPDTPVQKLEFFLQQLDLVLMMTVYPGQYGASFVPESLDRIRDLRTRYSGDIIVDGNQNPANAKLCKLAGANMFVSGSYIVNNNDSEKAFNILNEAVL